MTPQRSPDVPPSPKRRRHHHPRSTTAAAASITEIPSTAGAVSFRSVSSGWCALISGPDFVAAHASRGHAVPLVAVYSFRGKGTELRLTGMNGSVVRVIQDGGGPRKLSGGDLMCVLNQAFGTRVVEPATGDVLVTCPRLDDMSSSEDPLSTSKDVRRLSNVAFGLGRAVPSGEYKLVRLTDCVSCEVRAVEGDMGWKPAPSPPARVTCTSSCVAVVNGILHALGSRKGDRNVYCFDLESEKWKTTTMQGPQIEGARGYKLWMDTPYPYD
ncbi:hypothetical protein ZWY2020_016808 [Hordeum vulgare]|nr:hypothetical protein ZWY2020_016808 [Hordeum vulgare]